MAFLLSRIDRREREYTITATDDDGGDVTGDITALDFAIVPPRSPVTGATAWTSFPVVAGVVEVIYAAPDAGDKSAPALLVPVGGGDVHMREVDGPLVMAVRVERVSVV